MRRRGLVSQLYRTARLANDVSTISLNRPGSDGDSGPWKSSRGGHLP
jgi:hypothetical protein